MPDPDQDEAPQGTARLGAWLIVVGTATFTVVWVMGLLTASPAFSWHHSMISDLGSHACVVRNGYRMCSQHAASFNLGLVVAGIAVATASWCVRRVWGRPLTFATTSLGAGLLLLGLVPSDVSHGVHMVGAVLTLPMTAAGVLISAEAASAPLPPGGVARRARRRRVLHVRRSLGAVALVACLDHLLGDSGAVIPRGVAEAVSVVAIVTALLLEAWRFLSWRPRQGWQLPWRERAAPD
ncbi:hypothetical protein ACF3NS_04180 [Arsenicicoccus cauae]|uniref:DUF998 domain-containing protein n=1 Tax=Arsenicicoccus cauae TaxID=2663847 RepID=A0A6I3IEE4_9MICO|nr:hypothetical protein [Arsenicicoccus cauae]MTB72342.1 hypothetical protein [Arsenicicoccus cauae]